MDLIRTTIILTLAIAVGGKMCWSLSQIKTEIVTTEAMHDFETMFQRLKSNEELVNQLLGRIYMLEMRDKSHLERFQSLENQVENQKLQMRQFQTEAETREKNLQERIQALETNVKNQENQARKLQAELGSQRQRTRLLETILGQISKDKLTPDVNTNSEDLSRSTEAGKINHSHIIRSRIRRARSETTVAFTATVSDHDIEHAGDHQIIVFDNVITNVGNAYNSHVGTFIAPVNGIYVFSVTLSSPYGVSFHAIIVRNGQLLTRLYASSGESKGHQTASQTVVLQLQKGDDVCIQHADVDRIISGYKYTLFSGFLLQEDFSAPVVVG